MGHTPYRVGGGIGRSPPTQVTRSTVGSKLLNRYVSASRETLESTLHTPFSMPCTGVGCVFRGMNRKDKQLGRGVESVEQDWASEK